MSGTYNEVQVKKLGQKRAKTTKNPASISNIGSGPDQAAGHADNQPKSLNSSKSIKSSKSGEDASWPPQLQEFVSRSFQESEILDANATAVFNEQIQELIFSAARNNKLWTNDWEKQRLPVLDPTVPLALYSDSVDMDCIQTPPNQAKSHTKSAENPPKTAKYDSNERKRQRAARFHDESRASASPPPFSVSAENTSKEIVGTSTALEKRYLRLTSEPDPSMVRPVHVLGLSLSHVLKKYRNSNASYSYINDQLKAIRQDLTVQHIKTGLARRVYETHGRIAIENNDLGEFNQCQAQLKHLYAMKDGPVFFKKTFEYTCYRILYLLLTGNYADINLTRLELLDIESIADKSELEPEFQIKKSCVYKALELADFVVLGNFHGFFRTYRWFKGLETMGHAAHLIEHFMLNKQRVLSLNTMCKAFRKLPLVYVEQQLALEEGSAFFAEYGLSEYVVGSEFDCTNAKWPLQAIVDQGKFKKIDIKGQV